MPEPRHLAFGILAGVIDGDPARVDRATARPGSGGTAPARHAPSGPASADRACGRRPRGPRPARRRSSMASKRVSMRARSQARSGASSTVAKRQGAGSPSPFCQALSGRPVACDDFPGADMALAIARLQPRHDRRDRVRPGARGRPRRPSPAIRHWPGRARRRRIREWRRCPASGSGDRGPSRRTGSAARPSARQRSISAAARSRQRAADRVSRSGSTP